MASCEAQPSSTPVPQGRGLGVLTEAAGLPAGFPQVIDSPLTWTGAQFTDEGQYVLYLSRDDVAEAEAAVESFKGIWNFGNREGQY